MSSGLVPNRVQPVAGATHGHDLETESSETSELFPQPSDVDVDRLAITQVVVPPDLLEQDLTRKHPPRPVDQVGKQLPLFWGELQLDVVDHRPPPRPVYPQAAEPVLLDLGTDIPLLAAAEHGRHPGEQLAQGERLRDVVIGTQLQPNHLVHLALLRGHHDARHVALLAEDPADLEPAQLGKHQVEEDQIGPRVAGTTQPVGTVNRDRYEISLFLEVEAQRIPDGRVIL